MSRDRFEPDERTANALESIADSLDSIATDIKDFRKSLRKAFEMVEGKLDKSTDPKCKKCGHPRSSHHDDDGKLDSCQWNHYPGTAEHGSGDCDPCRCPFFVAP